MHLPIGIFHQSSDSMKLRLVLILLLFAASVGILVWLYCAATRAPRAPQVSPWTETLADLDACCRRKHVKSVQYDKFAAIAVGESRPDAERLFRAMAFSERLQEHHCAQAILHLGGSYTPPVRIVLFGGTTDGNLERSIAYELRTMQECKCGEINRALACDNRYAARLLIWASSVDMRQATLMHLCRAPQSSDTEWQYLVCPQCGNIFTSVYCEPYCPLCLTASQQFVRFE